MRDLRDDARGVHVAAEDLAVQAERDDALLDAGAGALVDADDRAAGLDGEVHHLGDLLAVDLAERAAEDREVLGEHADLAAVDRAVAGDHAVAVGAVLLQAERRRAVPGQLVELDEGALVEELLDPLAGGLAALGVLLLDRLRGAGVDGLVEAAVQVGELAGGRVDVDVLGDVGAFARVCAHASGLLAGSCCRSVGQCSARDLRRRPHAHPSTPPRPRRRRPRVEVVDGHALHQRGRRSSAPGAGAAEGLVVVAEHQTAGRGRLDRTWETPARAALTFSLLLRPERPRRPWPWLPLLTGYAVGAGAPRAGARGRREVAQRRADRRPQGRRHPGRAGRDPRRARPPSSASGSTSSTTRAELPVADRDLAGARAGVGRPTAPSCCSRCWPRCCEAYAAWQARRRRRGAAARRRTPRPA